MKNGSLLTFAFLFIIVTTSFSATRTWTGSSPGIWDATSAANWSGGVLPGPGDDVVIPTGKEITLQISVTIQSLEIGNGGGNSSLAIDPTYTLTVNFISGDGVFIEPGGMGTENTLEVNGNLVINHTGMGTTDDGIDARANTSLSVGSNGSISITSPGDNGLDLYAEFINSGDITITSPGDRGISFKSNISYDLTNNTSATLTVTSATNQGIQVGNGSNFTNDGTITLTTTGDPLIDDPGDFTNNGTVKGNGDINGTNFISNSNSRIAPGSSIGKFKFINDSGTQGLKDIFFDIEIEGSTTPGTDYDQVEVTNNIDISNAVLNLIEGSYTPMAGDIFTIIDVPVGGSITGTFNGISEGGSVTFKGVTLYFSYQGGDGNDFTASFDSPLPVELIDFSARAMDNEVKLGWTTANEVNNDYFTLERSKDGRTFEAIAMISGNGNSTELTKYIHMDQNPQNGMNYYRLKQTDFDGSFSYSDIETVKFEKDATIKVYPTAVAHTLTIETGRELDVESLVVISDGRGRTIASHALASKSNKQEIDVNDLVPGNYFISIYNKEKVHTFKIIKL